MEKNNGLKDNGSKDLPYGLADLEETNRVLETNQFSETPKELAIHTDLQQPNDSVNLNKLNGLTRTVLGIKGRPPGRSENIAAHNALLQQHKASSINIEHTRHDSDREDHNLDTGSVAGSVENILLSTEEQEVLRTITKFDIQQKNLKDLSFRKEYCKEIQDQSKKMQTPMRKNKNKGGGGGT
ncbi:hypothetical protein MKW98_004953 [Papaver atlanticum]|uniref:Uncharacterized protein n=1 Tax=Papaver atlanticum TaxID=357466 RepID=A0AAD4TFY3_9MAGN|nr:hypothetical protein MKW98_004953 [Papaver atlanticum]